ncbi:hypothetical protein C8Q78DRAFT_977718, partial [Trametes maxima]
DLQRNHILFNRLTASAMSGDETEPGSTVGRYRIIRARWQSAELRAFLRALDDIYREAWRSTVVRWGSRPRNRCSEGDWVTVDSPAPVGLWRNCYDSVWLGSLTLDERDALEIEEEDYHFDLTAHPSYVQA